MTWRAGVVGSPIAHSLSPVLHRAAYAALGLEDWSFHRDRVEPGGLAGFVAGLPGDWVGLAVTMPLKEEALALAAEAGEPVGQEARLVGGANTLLRSGVGWRAENTDVQGLERTLTEAGVGTDTGPEPTAAVVGSGATARSALAALSRCGITAVQLIVREQVRPGARELAQQLGLDLSTSRYADGPASWGSPGVVISTVPAAGTPPVTGWQLPPGAVVCDVVYAGWPTPWASDWAVQGVTVTGGDRLLLHQAVRQVELMTGRPGPLPAMEAALAEALSHQGAGSNR